MLSDIEIAQSAKLKRIDDLAHEWGLEDNEFERTAGTRPSSRSTRNARPTPS